MYMGVSENNGTPKSSILIGCSIINHPIWGTPILETPICCTSPTFHKVGRKPVVFFQSPCEWWCTHNKLPPCFVPFFSGTKFCTTCLWSLPFSTLQGKFQEPPMVRPTIPWLLEFGMGQVDMGSNGPTCLGVPWEISILLLELLDKSTAWVQL